MPARVPLDVDLEDKLLYGLTPMRLAYLMVALVAAFGIWSAHWAPPVVRGAAAVTVAATGAAMAWGRWQGRAADEWVVDIAAFAMNNHTIEWTLDWQPWPRFGRPQAAQLVDGLVLTESMPRAA